MDANHEPLLSATEAAHYLQLRHVSAIHKIANATGIGRRIGRHWMFTRAELDAYAAQRKHLRERGWKVVRSSRLQLPPDPPPAEADTIDVHAAAAILDVSVQWVYDLAKQGRLGRRRGTRWLFTRAEVVAYNATRTPTDRRPRTEQGDDA